MRVIEYQSTILYVIKAPSDMSILIVNSRAGEERVGVLPLYFLCIRCHYSLNVWNGSRHIRSYSFWWFPCDVVCLFREAIWAKWKVSPVLNVASISTVRWSLVDLWEHRPVGPWGQQVQRLVLNKVLPGDHAETTNQQQDFRSVLTKHYIGHGYVYVNQIMGFFLLEKKSDNLSLMLNWRDLSLNMK